jgi:hypothetical protein
VRGCVVGELASCNMLTWVLSRSNACGARACSHLHKAGGSPPHVSHSLTRGKRFCRVIDGVVAVAHAAQLWHQPTLGHQLVSTDMTTTRFGRTKFDLTTREQRTDLRYQLPLKGFPKPCNASLLHGPHEAHNRSAPIMS